MYPNHFYTKNLRFGETGYNFALNLVLKSSNLIYFPELADCATSCNLVLLKKYDSCEETRGKISFLPIEYLKNLFKQTYFEPPDFYDKLEEKEYYMRMFVNDDFFNESFLMKNTFKNVPLIYFRKPFLSSSLSKTMDMKQMQIKGDDILNNSIFKNPVLDYTKVIKQDKDEWLSIKDLSNIIHPNLFLLTEEKRKYVFFIPYFIFNIAYLNFNSAKQTIKSLFEQYTIPSEARFIIFIILYRGHFTSAIIDREVDVKGIKKKFAYFFNSAGYDPHDFNVNKNYWFIDSSIMIVNHRKIVKEKNEAKTNKNLVFEALCSVLSDKFEINNFVFNSFQNQYLNSECGIFSTMFLTCLIKLIDSKKDISKIIVKDIAFIYFNLLSLGCDHTYSLFRGLFFFTLDDIEKNKITEDYFKNTTNVFPMQNEKFIEFKNLCKKNINMLVDNIMDLSKTIDVDDNKIVY